MIVYKRNYSFRVLRNWLLGVGVLVLTIGVSLHPIWFDSSVVTTVQLLLNGRSLRPVPLNSVFGVADLYCAIGPYDSFRDVRFRRYLSETLQSKLEVTMRKQIPGGQSGHQIIVAGVSGEDINFLYRSVFLKKMNQKESHSVEDCVGPKGMAIVSFLERSIYLSN